MKRKKQKRVGKSDISSSDMEYMSDDFSVVKKNKHGIIEKLNSITVGGGKEKDYLIEYLAMLISSGMDVATSLKAIQSDLKVKWMQRLMHQVRQDIDAGHPVWKAFSRMRFVEPHIISLIKIGEESGQLSENLQAIVVQRQKEREFKSKVRSAMMYPIFVMTLTVIIGIGIAWFILPRLATVFASLGMDIPLITRILIAIGLFLQDYGFIAVPTAIVCALVLVYVMFFMKATKFIGQWMLFTMPGVRQLIREVELSQFGFVLGALLNAGLPIVDSIRSLENATVFYQFKKLYHTFANSIEEGRSFKNVFSTYHASKKLVPSSIQQMIVTAEQTGRLPETLTKIGQTFEVKVDTSTKNLSTMLEPILLVIVWLGVVSVALAVILPIYSLVGGFTEQVSKPQSVERSVIIEATTYNEPVVTQEVEVIDPVFAPKKMLQVSSVIGTLNVRSSPSSSGELIVQVKDGEEFEYVDESNDWYLIKLSDTEEGWVSGQYIKIVEQPAVTNAVEDADAIDATDSEVIL